MTVPEAFAVFLPALVVLFGPVVIALLRPARPHLDWPQRVASDGRTFAGIVASNRAPAAFMTHAAVLQAQAVANAQYQRVLALAIGGGGNAGGAGGGVGPIATSGGGIVVYSNAATLGALPSSDPRLAPDPSQPTTLGFRTWRFRADGLLRSPHQGTVWQEAELRCEAWDEGDVVRGMAGIHAHLVPMVWREAPNEFGVEWADAPLVTGLVERFGRFVLGTEGWRAEHVLIKALHAPNRAVAAALAVNYPEAEITWRQQAVSPDAEPRHADR